MKNSMFNVTNVTENANADFKIYDLGLKTNYAVTDRDGSHAVLENLNASVDAPERMTLSYAKDKAFTGTVEVAYPSPVMKPSRVVLKSDTVLTTTDDGDASYRVDEPVSLTTTIRFNRAGNITEEHLMTAIQRHISLLYKSDGSTRLGELMRGAAEPSAD